jgi:hypothetical protein
MVNFKRYDIDVKYLRSLAWQGDAVVDFIHGGIKYFRDGSNEEAPMLLIYAYPFDSVEVAGKSAVLYEKYGTKAILLRAQDLHLVRELNRSYYHAKDYAFPIVPFQLPDGRDAIIHCPQDYCSLDVELAESGEILTKRDYQSRDYFHSNLQVSLDGRYLVELAWVWQPWNVVVCYDLQQAINDPFHFDGYGIEVPQGGSRGWEPENVTIWGHQVVTASILEPGEKAEEESEFEVSPAEEGVPESEESQNKGKIRQVAASELCIVDGDGNPIDMSVTTKTPAGYHYLLQAYDLNNARILSSRLMPEMVGRMMPIGPSHIVSFYDHPKLIEVATGKVVLRWEDLYGGPEVGQPSAMLKPPKLPIVACDPAHQRFAIGIEEHITIIELGGLSL